MCRLSKSYTGTSVLLCESGKDIHHFEALVETASAEIAQQYGCSIFFLTLNDDFSNECILYSLQLTASKRLVTATPEHVGLLHKASLS